MSDRTDHREGRRRARVVAVRALLPVLALAACGAPAPVSDGSAAPAPPAVDTAAAEAHAAAAEAAERAGDVNAERQALTALVAVDPDDSTALMRLAQLELGAQLFVPAAEHLRRVVELRGQDRHASMALAHALQNAGQFTAAIEVLTSLKRHQDGPAAAVRLGWLHLVRGEVDAAEAEFTEVLDRWPADPGVRIGLGALYRQTGRLDDARAALEEARELGASDHQLHYQLALTYRALGRDLEARQEMQAFEAGGGTSTAANWLEGL